MAKDSGPTSFIAMLQLPEDKLRDALSSPPMKVRTALRRFGALSLYSVVAQRCSGDTGERKLSPFPDHAQPVW